MAAVRIAVVGGGVNGVSAGVRTLDAFPQAQVTIFTDKISPDTTGDGSAGLWGPFLCGTTPEAKMLRWSSDTHSFFKELWSGGFADEAGITLQPVIRICTDPKGYATPYWKNVVYGCRDLTDREVKKYSKEQGRAYTGGQHFVSFTGEPTKLLPFLMKRFIANGGVIRIGKKLDNLEELEGFSAIINCTGLGAKELAKDDQVTSIRGQVMRVAAPWMFGVFLDESDDGNYIIPNYDTVVLGGTHQVGDYNEEPCKYDSAFIKAGCEERVPALKHAAFIKEWVGLRPGRPEVRLEVDTRGSTPIVHNYGHGGSGVTLCWGCAGEVVDLLKTVLTDPERLQSKL